MKKSVFYSFLREKIKIMKEFKMKLRKGFEGIGDFEMEWLTPEEQEIRWAEHRKRIEDLKKSGEYGEEYDFVISVEEDKVLDKPTESGGVSFSTLIWDVNDLERYECNSSNWK